MKENETKDNQEKITDACDAPNLDKDEERVIRIRDAVIDSSEEINLFNVLWAKDEIEVLLEAECMKAHKSACEGESEDKRKELMKDLIMIIVRRYGGAISESILFSLLGSFLEFIDALFSLIRDGKLARIVGVDGSSVCFYEPPFEPVINTECQTQSGFREVFNGINEIRNEMISLFEGSEDKAHRASRAAYLQTKLIEYALGRVNPRICQDCGEMIFYGDPIPRYGDGCNHCCNKKATEMTTVMNEHYDKMYFSFGKEKQQ